MSCFLQPAIDRSACRAWWCSCHHICKSSFQVRSHQFVFKSYLLLTLLSDISFDAICSYPLDVTLRHPLSGVRSSMRRAQQEQRPGLPHSLQEMNALLANPRYANLLATLDGQDNLYAGQAGNCVVLSSQRMLAVLAECQTIFCDGTFFGVPVDVGAEQLLTIVTLRDHHVSFLCMHLFMILCIELFISNLPDLFQIIPLVHVLMPNRTTETYMEVFNFLVYLVPNLNPSLIVSDFEAALMAALRNVFPGARLLGCFWHYATVSSTYFNIVLFFCWFVPLLTFFFFSGCCKKFKTFRSSCSAERKSRGQSHCANVHVHSTLPSLADCRGFSCN